MNFHIVTLFPESFDSYLDESILARAIKDKKIKVRFYNPRDFTPTSLKLRGASKYRRVDRKPYGGGPGMVLEPISLIKAVEKVIKNCKTKPKIIWLSPNKKTFDNAYAEKLSKKNKDILIICGRYEGIDARVRKIFRAEELSIGPYVLTGGELAAMVIIDTVSRRIPGVLGNMDSIEENRISTSEVYTRPEVLEHKNKKYRVPKVLLSGDHKKIEAWKNGR